MLLILEGSNCVGKTTFARHLKNNGWCYFKDTGCNLIGEEHFERLNQYRTSMISQIEVLKALSEQTNIVVDRFHITEMVYRSMSPLVCGKTYIECLRAVNDEIEERIPNGTKLMLLKREYREDEKMKEYLDDIQNKFESEVKRSKLDSMTIDISSVDLSKVHEWIGVGIGQNKKIVFTEGKVSI